MPSVSDRILRGMMTRGNEKIKKIGKFGTGKSSTDDASCKQVYLSKIQYLMHICQEKRRQNQQKAATLLHEVSGKLTQQCCTKGMQGISSASQLERLMTTVRKGRKNRGSQDLKSQFPQGPGPTGHYWLSDLFSIVEKSYSLSAYQGLRENLRLIHLQALKPILSLIFIGLL